MASVNKIVLLGRLGKDPEIRQAGSTSVAEFTLATSEKWKDKATGEVKENTTWHNAKCWGRTAEIASQFLSKGAMAHLIGKQEHEDYVTKDGEKRRKSYVTVQELTLVSGGKANAISDGNGESCQPQQGSSKPQPVPAERKRFVKPDEFPDEEVPF